ncbi:hypothetical protein AC579_3238 [Pseudocercospora musae]|uniref:Uncharacterized protein n=1 Tax=Pseudocercospora musae TaxID=113226 RepID=A0A139GT57_9PEZI|nr:hypothetical protein AC579_3238 [Pseudocercospora musae]
MLDPGGIEDIEQEEADEEGLAAGMSPKQKYNAIMQQLRSFTMPFEKMLVMWAGTPGTATYRKNMETIQHVFPNEGLVGSVVLRDELKGLIGTSTQSLQPPNLQDMAQIIKNRAPTWFNLLDSSLLPNTRKEHKQYAISFEHKRNIIPKRACTITYIVVHSIAAKRSSVLTKSLGLYLVCSSRAPVHVIDTLSNMVITNGYDSIQELMKKNANQGRQQVKLIALLPTSWIAFDNFNR